MLNFSLSCNCCIPAAILQSGYLLKIFTSYFYYLCSSLEPLPPPQPPPSSLFSKLASIPDLLISIFQTTQRVHILSFGNVLKFLWFLRTKTKTLHVSGKAFHEVPLLPFPPLSTWTQVEFLSVSGKHHDLSHLLLFANIVFSS